MLHSVPVRARAAAARVRRGPQVRDAFALGRRCTTAPFPAGVTSSAARSYASAAGEDESEQEAMHQAIRESVQALCR
jgi:hypothetical protein